MKNKIFILFWCMLPVAALAQTANTNTTAVPFLTIGPDARAAALGNAGVASSPDVNAQYWNPAKYVFSDTKFGVGFNYAPMQQHFGNVYNAYASGFYKIDDVQSVSASFRYFSYGDEITYKDENNVDMGTLQANDMAIDFAYSRKFGPHFSGALTFRYIRSDIAPESTGAKTGQAAAADAAVYYRRPVKLFGGNFNMGLGAILSNIGTKISYVENGSSDALPMNLRIGGALQYEASENHRIGLLLDFNKLLLDKNNGLTTSVGMEYNYMGNIFLRAGYMAQAIDKGSESFFAAGAGVVYKMLCFDFAYLIPTQNSSIFSNTYRLSLAINF